MIKPEWGTKRTCPQTGERFYDLGKDNPVTSPSGVQWYPEPILKSKQPMPYDAPKKEPVKDETPDGDLNEDLDIDEEEEAPVDDDTDIGGDDDLGVTTLDADEDH